PGPTTVVPGFAAAPAGPPVWFRPETAPPGSAVTAAAVRAAGPGPAPVLDAAGPAPPRAGRSVRRLPLRGRRSVGPVGPGCGYCGRRGRRPRRRGSGG